MTESILDQTYIPVKCSLNNLNNVFLLVLLYVAVKSALFVHIVRSRLN